MRHGIVCMWLLRLAVALWLHVLARSIVRHLMAAGRGNTPLLHRWLWLLGI